MPPLPNHVRRGEIITAEFINGILDELSSLSSKVAALETAGVATNRVVINGFSGPTPLRVGDRLEVNGRGFSVPAILNQVLVGGQLVRSFAFDSSDTRLVFEIPEVPELDPAGSFVNVNVTNNNGSATGQILLRPRLVVPHGRLQIDYSAAPVMPFSQQNITPGLAYTFTFRITAFVDRETTYTLSPSVVGTAGFSVELLQENADVVRPNNLLTIPGGPSGVSRDVRVRVNVSAGVANGSTAPVRLSVTENTPGTNVTPGNQQIDVTVGSPPPTPENRVRVSLRLADSGASIQGIGVRFTRTSAGRVQFTLQFTEGGNYSVTVQMRNLTGWTAPSIDVPNPNVTNPTAGATTNQNINVLITAGSSATDTEMIVTVQRGTDLTVRYTLPVSVV